jgi:hypothetical protein
VVGVVAAQSEPAVVVIAKPKRSAKVVVPPTDLELEAERAKRDAAYWANAKAEWEAGRAREWPLPFDSSRYVR